MKRIQNLVEPRTKSTIYFTFLSTPASLHEIALIKVASLLWHRALLNDRPWRQNINDLDAYLGMYHDYGTLPISTNNWNVDGDISVLETWHKSPPIHFLTKRIDDYAFEKDTLDMVSLLKTRIPVELEKKLRRLVSQMGIVLGNWIKHHFYVFVDRACFEILLTDYFDDFVWYYDGKPNLCYEQTAKNFLSRDKLTELDKFCVACEYCMIDEINTRWPAVRENQFIKNLQFDRYEILFYWVHYLTNQLHKVSNSRSQTVEEFMILSTAYHNRNSSEYFWNFVRAEKRVPKMIRFLKSSTGFVLKPALEKLTQSEWESLMKSAADQVLIYLLDFVRKSDYVLQVWRRFKTTLTSDQFYKILLWIFQYEFQIESKFFTNDLRQAFTQIWLEAPTKLKQDALNRFTEDGTFVEYTIGLLRGLPRPMEFLILVLGDASAEQRSKIWKENWLELIYGTRPRYLKELMELCLGKDKVGEFKITEMAKFDNIREYCVDLMGHACFKELDVFLDFVCESDKLKIAELEGKICGLWRDFIYHESYSRDLDRLD